MRRLFSLLRLLFGMPLAMAAVGVEIHTPASIRACTHATRCPVAILSPGYGRSGRRRLRPTQSEHRHIADRRRFRGAHACNY